MPKMCAACGQTHTCSVFGNRVRPQVCGCPAGRADKRRVNQVACVFNMNISIVPIDIRTHILATRNRKSDVGHNLRAMLSARAKLYGRSNGRDELVFDSALVVFLWIFNDRALGGTRFHSYMCIQSSNLWVIWAGGSSVCVCECVCACVCVCANVYDTEMRARLRASRTYASRRTARSANWLHAAQGISSVSTGFEFIVGAKSVRECERACLPCLRIRRVGFSQCVKRDQQIALGYLICALSNVPVRNLPYIHPSGIVR